MFDLGYDTDHYLVLTPYNAQSRMRLAIKNGGDEQVLDCPSRLSLLRWKHVTVTMKPGKTAIYIDGEKVAETDAISISPADVHPIVNWLGRSRFSADPSLTGYLDDIRIYNYAMTDDGVAQLFRESSAVVSLDDDRQQPSQIYTIDGKRLDNPQRGLIIVDGKKEWHE